MSRLKEYTTILKVAWPIMISYLTYQILGITDMLMVGRLGPDALASVGLAITLFMFVGLPLQGIFDSTLILLSREYGAKNYGRFKRTLVHELLLGALFSIGGLILFPLLAWILKFMSPTDLVYSHAREYLFYSLLGMVPFIVSWILIKSLISVEKNKALAVISNFTMLLNILLNYMLIFGKLGAPEMGVTGSAVATLIARLVQAVILLVYCYVLFSRMFPGKCLFKFDWVLTKEIFKIGFPMGQANLVEVGAWTMFVGAISSLGVVALAAHEICMKIKDVAFMPGLALSSVATSNIGNAVGRKDFKETVRSCITVTKVTVVVMGIVGILIFVFPSQLVGLFTKDLAVVDAGVSLLKLLIIYQIIDAVFIVLRGSLNGLGSTKVVRNVLIFGSWMIMLPLAYALIYWTNLGVMGPWIALTVNVLVSGIIMGFYFKRRNESLACGVGK